MEGCISSRSLRSFLHLTVELSAIIGLEKVIMIAPSIQRREYLKLVSYVEIFAVDSKTMAIVILAGL